MHASTSPVKMQRSSGCGSSKGLLGPIGTLESYIHRTSRPALLEQGAEQALARKNREEGCASSRASLVEAHLRLVVSLARSYRGYGLPMEDLIQEGNVGLLKAADRFDPEQGVRFVSYATHWIKAEINEYVIRNWRLVKSATTKAQRKLFFNLRSFKDDFKTLSSAQVTELAGALNVKPEEVREMEMRLAGGDVPIDAPDGDDDERFSPMDHLASRHGNPEQAIQRRNFDALQSEGLQHAMECLDPRSRRILESRWLPADGEEPVKLRVLADEFNVSMERIRQIEARALQIMRTSLSSYPVQ